MMFPLIAALLAAQNVRSDVAFLDMRGEPGPMTDAELREKIRQSAGEVASNGLDEDHEWARGFMRRLIRDGRKERRRARMRRKQRRGWA